MTQHYGVSLMNVRRPRRKLLLVAEWVRRAMPILEEATNRDDDLTPVRIAADIALNCALDQYQFEAARNAIHPDFSLHAAEIASPVHDRLRHTTGGSHRERERDDRAADVAMAASYAARAIHWLYAGQGGFFDRCLETAVAHAARLGREFRAVMSATASYATTPDHSVFKVKWRTETAVDLARGIVAEEAYDRMPVLADALEEAGFADEFDVRLRRMRSSAASHFTRADWVLWSLTQPEE